ncbi:Protein CBG27925 [Caenorhabditis briggsae]|uniref:Uncharacterized protein n=2 Tax=Caenorhabditis briggsae TaxID=6238 RepID=A0AAE9FMN0_CAEBR|nr:Protein CBG27925 [Caenorhabditis briggsae]ULT83755.1 hypothetical protein L3Y34_012782 [Caenorhabditis briggsae]UMM43012.1 hypothetical protein L5515_018632 [Caenorhabditis briggsae]CAS00097.1 Protein CBG27925 [Caenorhabditis briggsae]
MSDSVSLELEQFSLDQTRVCDCAEIFRQPVNNRYDKSFDVYLGGEPEPGTLGLMLYHNQRFHGTPLTEQISQLVQYFDFWKEMGRNCDISRAITDVMSNVKLLENDKDNKLFPPCQRRVCSDPEMMGELNHLMVMETFLTPFGVTKIVSPDRPGFRPYKWNEDTDAGIVSIYDQSSSANREAERNPRKRCNESAQLMRKFHGNEEGEVNDAERNI